MFETEEFLIAIREEGSELVRDSLEGVSSKFNDVVQEVSAGADEMEAFSERYAGAAAVAVAGITVASAGLLSQVPIIGSVFDAFGGIIEAVAYKIDEVLRPALQPVVQFLYDIEAAVYDAEGPLGTFIGVFGLLAAVAGTVLGTIVLVASQLLGWPAVFAAAAAAVKTVVGAVVGLIGTFLGLPAIVLLAIAAAAAFAVAWLTNFRGTRDKTNEIVGQIWEYLKGLGADILEWARGIDLSDFIGAFRSVGASVKSFLDGLIDDMVQKGKDLINSLVSGIMAAISNTAGWVADLITGGGSASVQADISQSGSDSSQVGPDRGPTFGQQASVTYNFNLDDASVAESNSRATTTTTNANGGISR